MPNEVKNEKRVKISVVEENAETIKDASLKPFSAPPPEESPKMSEATITDKNDKMPFWIMFLAFFLGLSLGAGLIGGLFYFRSRVEINDREPTTAEIKATPTSDLSKDISVSEATSSATKKEEIDLSQYKIQILNGSGIKGGAGTVESLLNKAGFTDTATGNAASYDFQETEIAVKKDIDTDLTAKIVKTLDTYATKTKDLNSSTFDVVVTVGSKKN